MPRARKRRQALSKARASDTVRLGCLLLPLIALAAVILGPSGAGAQTPPGTQGSPAARPPEDATAAPTAAPGEVKPKPKPKEKPKTAPVLQDPPPEISAPGPAEGETLPPADNPNGAAAEDAEVPPRYRMPAPPAGAHYPGPTPVGSDTDPTTGEIHLPSRISTRLRVLASDLDALANRGGPSLTNGVLSVVTGGLSIALGALLDEPSLTPFLYVFGATSAARGVVDLAVSPDPDTVALEFSHMPMRNVAEVKLRLQFGERGLIELADQSRLARILDGALSIAGGVAVVPLVLIPLSEDDDRELEALDVFVIIGASISILSGVVNIVTDSEAERREEAYTKLKHKLARPAPKTPERQVSMSLSPYGATVWVAQRF